uniref:CLP1_P domain-containing protein n=1 Tax=Steinernema glaseri TaxID=37863 RepID=A0A1I8A5G5_9BILA
MVGKPIAKPIAKKKNRKRRNKAGNRAATGTAPDISLFVADVSDNEEGTRASQGTAESTETLILASDTEDPTPEPSSVAPVTPSEMADDLSYWERTQACIFPGDKKYRHILLVDNSPIFVFGRFRVQCLFGTATINDVVLEAGNFGAERWEDACFPYNMEMPGILKHKHGCQNKSPNMQRLKWRLAQCTQDAQQIVSAYHSSKAVVLIEGRIDDEDPDYIFRTFCQTVGYYSMLPVISHYGKVMGSYAFSKKPLSPLYSDSVESPIKEWDRSVNEHIDRNQVTIVLGNKGVGKSSLTRHLANIRRNQKADNVYVLDLDVGQPLFGPPGSIGLHKVEYPLLGASFAFQQLEFTNSIFIGTIDLSRIDPKEYAIRIESLMKTYRSLEPGNHLIVNTPGWIEDSGVHYINAILDVVLPDYMFNLRSQKFQNYKPRQSDVTRRSLRIFEPFVHRNLGDQFSEDRPPQLSASSMRSLQCTAYMSALGPVFATMRPYEVGFSNMILHLSVGTTRLPDNMYLGAFNQTFVALCSTEKKNVRRLMNNEKMPYRVVGEGGQPIEWLKCIGYGLVRAVDVEKRRFYLLTPVSLKELKKVNVLSRCEDINLSQNYMACQAHKEAPYWIWVKTDTTRSRSDRDKDLMSHLYNKVDFVTMKKRYYKHTARNELDN